MHENQISGAIVDAAIAVHKELGPGLLESVYESCLNFELCSRGIFVLRQHPLPVIYRGHQLEAGYRLDLLVEQLVVVEIKAVDRLHDLHTAQILTYLKLSQRKLGLLLNFNVVQMKEGIRRVVHGLK